MALIQETLDRKIWAKNWLTKRWLHNSLLSWQKLYRKKINYTRRQISTWYRTQYFISHAYRDMKQNIARNEDIFVAVLLASGVIGFSLAVMAANLLFQALLAVYVVADALGLSMVIVFGIAGIAYLLLMVWMIAWMQNMVSIAIWQGSNSNQRRSARNTIRQGLKYSTKTAGAWAYIMYRTALPLSLAAIIGLIILQLFGYQNIEAIIGVAAVSLVALVFSMRKLVQLTLTPAVMLFEGSETYKQAAQRSRQLIARRGSLFLTVGYILLLAAILGITGLCWLVLSHLLGANWQVFAAIFSIALATVANGMLVAFYRKRRLARVN